MSKKTDTSLTATQIAGMIDHTLLKANAELADFDRLCDEAREHGFASVAINGAMVDYCAKQLAGSGVAVCCVAGFPLGQSTTETKVFEARDAIARGAAEIDFVVNVVDVKSGRSDKVADELKRLADACSDVVSKVILETCYLTDDEKRQVCRCAIDAGIDFVKTSTGMGSAGATLDDVKLIKSVVGDRAKIKAAGGIRSLHDVLAFIAAGADRIGASAGVTIVEEAIAAGL